MVAETISLGILSLPAAVGAVGLAPGLAILISMGILASYNGYVIGQIKLRFPHISSMSDAGEVLMGPFGRELLNAAQILLLIFIMASHILTFTVAFNVITGHATCSIVFGVVGAVISCLLSLPRTLEKVSWLSLVCELCCHRPDYLGLTSSSICQCLRRGDGHHDQYWDHQANLDMGSRQANRFGDWLWCRYEHGFRIW
jgi:hypothetical protein